MIDSGEPDAPVGTSVLRPEDEALSRAAERFGTPLYVLNVSAIERAVAEAETAFGLEQIPQYSLQANNLPATAMRLHSRG